MRNIDKKYHYLYKTTNLINNKYYYGIHSTNNLVDGYLGSGIYLRRAIRKYGKDNFKREIIKMFDNREELVQGEINLITEDVLKDKQNMNCQYGGEGFNTIGMVTVKDKDGNTMKVFCNDPRYLTGELKHNITGYVNVMNYDGTVLHICKNDERYLSGELVHFNTNKTPVKDKNGNILYINKNDERYLSGELVGCTKGYVTVKDKDGNIFNVDINDPRYLSGAVKTIWDGKKHSEETKEKIGKSNSIKQKGENNSQFGTCWITKDGENKKIKKEELETFINQGWNKGRKLKN